MALSAVWPHHRQEPESLGVGVAGEGVGGGREATGCYGEQVFGVEGVVIRKHGMSP